MLRAEALLEAPQGVKGEDEEGQKCEEGRGGGRQRVDEMPGEGRESEGRESGGYVSGDGDRLPHGWRRQ